MRESPLFAFPPPLSRKQARLTRAQRDQWDEKGFLILPAFFSPDEIRAVNSLIDRRLANPETFGNATLVDAIAGPHAGKRFRACEAPRQVFEVPVKINDLFLDEPEVRGLASNEQLLPLISELLHGAPMVCNSLNFIWGSQQPHHCDLWFMPPPSRFATKHAKALALKIGPARALVDRGFEFLKSHERPAQDRLTVSSICLEDVHADAGPLTYYPGSHRIPPYRFSHGGIHAVKTELPQSEAYMERKIKEAGLKREEFMGKAGDVFLWHGQLLHGGSRIHEPSRTRKTLVTHYWRAGDVPRERCLQVHGAAFYQKREA